MHPTLFTIFGIPISSYGVMNAIGYIVGISYLIKNRDKIGISKDMLWDILFITIFAAVLGGKLMHILVEVRPTSLAEWKSIVLNFRYGYVFFGGFLAVVASLAVFLRVKKMPFFKTFDFLAVALPLGHAIGRIGCFLVGCCHGKPWNGPWAVTFHNHDALVEPEVLGVPVHPTQLYEVIINLLIFAILHVVYNKKPKTGSVVALYAALYGASRFCMEFFRGDFRGTGLLGMSPSQIVSICIILGAGLFYIFYVRKQNANH
ncbi:phosphatidylglycerol:prolipoprotein diacylglycerol transferase [Parelusimicrobium proximum]|uniref:prolipoprotein diacylglyceryl transferase n=1 Tax=Parelusimicrobium proximum TaxID=3228953 RepID=UPI003D16A96C